MQMFYIRRDLGIQKKYMMQAKMIYKLFYTAAFELR